MYPRKAWEVSYKRDRAAGISRYVDPGPSRERLRQLHEAHVPARTLARAAGLSDTAVREILDGSRTHVQRSTESRINRLSLSGIYAEQQTGHVPRIGAVRRLQALMAMGWSHDRLEAEGAPGSRNLMYREGHLISIGRWRQIREVYDRLSMTPGPSERTRRWAQALGYAPPLAWDDDTIDDPQAEPAGVLDHGPGAPVVDLVAIRRTIASQSEATPVTRTEQVHVVTAMAARGATDTRIAEHLGLSERTILRIRQRHEIPAGQPTSRPAATAAAYPPATQPASAPTGGTHNSAAAATRRLRTPLNDRNPPATHTLTVSPL